MHALTSNADFAILGREADAGARRLARHLDVRLHDIEDLRQDLLVDLLSRFSRYDSRRGSVGAFAGKIVANRCARLKQAVRRERTVFGVRPASLDDAVPDGDGLSRGDLLHEGDGYAGVVGQPVVDAEAIDRRLSLYSSLRKLPAHEQRLCLALGRWSPAELVGLGVATRSSLYRRIASLRLALIAFGVRA